MISLEQRLADVIQGEVDKAVTDVRYAAECAIAAFRALADRIVRGEQTAAPAPAPVTEIAGGSDYLKAFALAKADADPVMLHASVREYTCTDPVAAASNMRV